MEEAKNSDGILRNDEQELLVAVCNNAPMDIVTSLISPTNINVQDSSGNTALHKAVVKKKWDLVPVLLQHGADVNTGNDCQETPLYLAVEHDAPADIITRLISPYNINIKEDDRKWELVQGLLSSSGNTVLHEVVRKKNWELVPVLLQHGADVNITNDRQETALYLAVEYDAPADIIASLISPHIINMQDIVIFDDMQDEDDDEDGDTVLHSAVSRERWELVSVLLQHGADVNMCGYDHNTPLHSAACRGAPADIITQLISPHNINMKDCGDTALHLVVEKERWDLVPVLLQHGADVNLGDDCKRTALHLAVYGAPADIITQLSSPHNINMQDEGGNTALQRAVKREKWELVPVLLQNGADPYVTGILPEPPRPFSLQSLTIATIRSHMPVKSDEAYEKLRLPHLLPELKLNPLADEIVAIKRKEDVK